MQICVFHSIYEKICIHEVQKAEYDEKWIWRLYKMSDFVF